MSSTPVIDRRRDRRVRRFFLRVLLHGFVYDLVLNRPWLRRFRPDPLPRWIRIARRFRSFAVEMGGVLIKLGQFLSTRVDILPREITQELAGLQDEVPPAPTAEVIVQIEEDFGRPLDELFIRFGEEAIGAASLAQAHRATLPDGTDVVVKCLRPRIDVLVETDLRAIRDTLRRLKLWRTVSRRVDFDRLADELETVTRGELDLEREALSAERFAEMFEGDDGIRAPKVYHRRVARRTLTLEDVGFLKIDDLDALRDAGISPVEVARRLWDSYLRQIFIHHTVHADPHPGNLFIEPLEDADGAADGEEAGGRPFRLIFVDFGMIVTIPPRLRTGIREYVIGLGTRDAARIVRAYRQAGVLLPGADTARLVDAHEELLSRFWGVRLGDLRDVAFGEIGSLMHEYRDLLRDAPFQAQVALVFVDRAIGILIGLVTSLDDEFDLWESTKPMAQKLLLDETEPFLGEVAAEARAVAGLPRRFEKVLDAAAGGRLEVRAGLAGDSRRAVDRLERSVARLTRTVAASGLAVSGSLLLADGQISLGWGILSAAGALLLWGLFG